MNKKITREDIKKYIDGIREAIQDPEIAHSIEDDLYHDFVRFVSKYAENEKMRMLAEEVLKSENIDFPKYYS